MGLFEYISVLTSIIIGLGIAHLLRGVAQLIQHPGRYAVYWVHLVWVGFMFVQMIFWWWWQFKLTELSVWHFQHYMFLLIYAVLLYLICALLFPSDLDEYSGYEDYFYSRRAWYFGLQTIVGFVDLYDTWLKGADHFFALGMQYYATSVLITALCVFAIFSSSRRYHATLAIAMLTYQFVWVFQYWSTQG
jgi:hypothetical protein